MTKQQVQDIWINSLKETKFENHGLGAMYFKERQLLNKLGIIVSRKDQTGEVHDLIKDPQGWEEYFKLKREVEQDKKYSRLNGLDELARTGRP